jgi:4-hydroxybenzoate polyprenyltransferase
MEREYAAMKRPRGVTVLACLYFVVAFSVLFTLVPSQAFNPLQHQRLLAQSVAFLVIAITLGIALLRMKRWSRWLAITISAAQLLSVVYGVAVAHSSSPAGRLALRIWFAVWAIWYLTRPQVKAAFQSA